jgi:hypothetical protein
MTCTPDLPLAGKQPAGPCLMSCSAAVQLPAIHKMIVIQGLELTPVG